MEVNDNFACWKLQWRKKFILRFPSSKIKKRMHKFSIRILCVRKKNICMLHTCQLRWMPRHGGRVRPPPGPPWWPWPGPRPGRDPAGWPTPGCRQSGQCWAGPIWGRWAGRLGRSSRWCAGRSILHKAERILIKNQSVVNHNLSNQRWFDNV